MAPPKHHSVASVQEIAIGMMMVTVRVRRIR